MGRERYARVVAELQRRARDDRIATTFEVIYGHAWKGEPTRSADGLPIVKRERRRQG